MTNGRRGWRQGNRQATTNLDSIAALRSVDPDFAVDLPEGGDARTSLENERLRADTGFEPEWNFERAAADYVASLRDGHDSWPTQRLVPLTN